MKNIFLFLLIICCSLNSNIWSKNILVYNNITINDQTQSKAVKYATQALREDFNRKFGNTLRKDKSPIELKFIIDKKSEDDFDKFQISYSQSNITFKGCDELGVVHAIYSFSEDVLGIDPFIHFTHLMPKLEKEVTVKQSVINSPKYTFTHRGFFINDEDLICGFQMEKLAYGFNLDFMKKIFETMLRLKMTGVIPSTLVLSDEPHLVLASDMGLYIMQHHAEPIGSVPLYWPKNQEYSWSSNKEQFIKFWSTAIERQKGKHVIWTLNFRGLLDRDFWRDDPAFQGKVTDEQKAKVVNEAIETQYELIKKIRHESDPLITGVLRGGIGSLYLKGLLKFPPKTMIQFTDGSDALFTDNMWKSADTCPYPMGVYKHVSLHNRKAHMRINFCDPNEQCEVFQKLCDKKMTNICVLNVGNIKEKIFGIQQMVNYMNNFEAYKNQNHDEYYTWYVKNKFNSDNSDLAQVYKDFINNQFRFDSNRYGDEFFSYYVERILNMVMKREIDFPFLKVASTKSIQSKMMGEKDFVKNMNISLGYYANLFDSVSNKWNVSVQRAFESQSSLTGNRLDFYKVDALYPTQKMCYLTNMAANLSDAALKYVNNDMHNAQLSLYKAIEYQKKVEDMEKQIENNHGGEFKDWYRWDQNAITWEIRPFMEHFMDIIKDLNRINMPYQYRNSKTPSIQYKYQPYFNSKYKDELFYMENAQ